MEKEIEDAAISFSHVTFHYPPTSHSTSPFHLKPISVSTLAKAAAKKLKKGKSEAILVDLARAPINTQFEMTLKDLSFHVAPNSISAIVGMSSSGKSTVLKLLMRLYDPQNGIIKLNGTDIKSMDPVLLQRQFGVVTSRTYIFKGTIAENINYNGIGLPLEWHWAAEADDYREDTIKDAFSTGSHNSIPDFSLLSSNRSFSSFFSESQRAPLFEEPRWTGDDSSDEEGGPELFPRPSETPPSERSSGYDSVEVDVDAEDKRRKEALKKLEEDIKKAASKAQLDTWLEELPLGLQTPLPEGGGDLAVGHRLRISLARTLLKNPPVIIFDDPTKATDTETTWMVQRHLRKMAKNKTVLIATSQLSLARHADQILVLDDGEIVEQGSHERLLSNEGPYHDLWNIFTGEIPDDTVYPEGDIRNPRMRLRRSQLRLVDLWG